ncbi:MAG: heparan-alpha-glucosaminide N-acetyltransferase domain-containing protein [Promethearchaeota archaeon]
MSNKTDILNKRIESIDFLRGLTIIFMIMYHIKIFWFERASGFFIEFIMVLGLIAAPFFLIISGIGFNLYISNSIKKDLSKIQIYIEIIKRAIIIFFISTLLNFLFGIFFISKFLFLYWSVFQLIAISMLLSGIIILNRKWKLLFVILLIIILFALNQNILLLNSKLFDILFEGSFPFFPWVYCFLLGILIGISIEKLNKDNFKIIAICYLILSINALLLWYLWFRIYFAESLELNLFLCSVGTFLILFLFFYLILDFKEINFRVNKVIEKWGKLSFSIYYIHFIIIYGVLILFTLYFYEDFQLTFGYYYYLIICLIFLMTIESFLLLWKKINYKYGAEWILNLLSKKSLFSKINHKT